MIDIKPISLLQGTHEDTATTGQGCFMNVISYLNGESQITDQSPCVCATVRPLAIKLNDLGTDEQRARLLPFVLRAMGSATEDRAVIHRRIDLLRQYGKECLAEIAAWRAGMKAKPYANTYAYAKAYANANAYANADADAYANAKAYAYAKAYANANAYADAYAYATANAYAKAKAYANAAKLKASLFEAGLRFLDAALPPTEAANSVVIQRFEKLAQLQGVAA